MSGTGLRRGNPVHMHPPAKPSAAKPATQRKSASDKAVVKDPASMVRRVSGKKTEPDTQAVGKRPGASALARKIGDRKI